MSPAHRLIEELKALGVVLVARQGRLRARAAEAALTPEVRRLIADHRGPLLAALTGRPVPTDDPAFVWDPAGGVRCASPVDIRALCLARAAGLAPRPFPRIELEASCVGVEPGRRAWESFCRSAPWAAVAEALLLMDDSEAVAEAEVRAISLLF